MRTGGRTDRHDEANSRFSQNCEKRLETVVPGIKHPTPSRSQLRYLRTYPVILICRLLKAERRTRVFPSSSVINFGFSPYRPT